MLVKTCLLIACDICVIFIFKAGGMERTKALPKIRDADKESMFGYVYAVSGPGRVQHLLSALFGCTMKVHKIEPS